MRGKRSGTARFYLILGLVAAACIIALTYSLSSGRTSAATAEPVELDIPDAQTLVQLAQGVQKGDPDAPVTILEFADYQCPACSQYAQMVAPQVDERLVQTGRAKYVFYDFPIVSGHPNSFLAARAARCAGDQDRYWEYHDHLFRTQGRWSSMGSVVGTFVDYAEELGLDRGEFEACLRSDKFADVVTANLELGRQLGIPGTPSFLVRGGQGMATRISDWYFETFENAVEEAEGFLLVEGG